MKLLAVIQSLYNALDQAELSRTKCILVAKCIALKHGDDGAERRTKRYTTFKSSTHMLISAAEENEVPVEERGPSCVIVAIATLYVPVTAVAN